MRKVRLSIIGLVIANALAGGMLMSLYFVGRRVPAEYRRKFSEIAGRHEAGNYREAIDEYRELYGKYGIESSNLYYNIGNAYHHVAQEEQAGEQELYSRAMQYYKKAQRLKPGDQDVSRNIALLERELGVRNRDPRKHRDGVKKYLFRLIGVYSIYGWTVFTVANYWRFSIALVLLMFFGSRRRFFIYLALVMGVIFFISLALGGARAYLDLTSREGIILSAEQPAMYDPDEESAGVFTPTRGAVVRIVRAKGDWYKIRLLNGGAGWVKRDTIGEI